MQEVPEVGCRRFRRLGSGGSGRAPATFGTRNLQTRTSRNLRYLQNPRNLQLQLQLYPNISFAFATAAASASTSSRVLYSANDARAVAAMP